MDVSTLFQQKVYPVAAVYMTGSKDQLILSVANIQSWYRITLSAEQAKTLGEALLQGASDIEMIHKERSNEL